MISLFGCCPVMMFGQSRLVQGSTYVSTYVGHLGLFEHRLT